MLAWKFWPGHEDSQFYNKLSGKTEPPEDSHQTDVAVNCQKTLEHLILNQDGGGKNVN